MILAPSRLPRTGWPTAGLIPEFHWGVVLDAEMTVRSQEPDFVTEVRPDRADGRTGTFVAGCSPLHFPTKIRDILDETVHLLMRRRVMPKGAQR